MNNHIVQERLTAAELDIMLCLWKYTEPVRTAHLLADLQPIHSWTLSTLKVLLGRLEEKGYVQVTRQGRFTLYQPLVAEAEYRRRETGGLLHRFFGGSPQKLVACLVEEGSLTGEDIAALEAILRKAREDHADESL